MAEDKVVRFHLLTYWIVFEGVYEPANGLMTGHYRGVGRFTGETLEPGNFEVGDWNYRYTYPRRSDGKRVTDLIPASGVKRVP